MPTYSALKTSIINNVRRQTTEYLLELPNIINDAKYQICQRKKYWFLENRQQFAITQGVGSWWQITLPAGSSYASLPDDIFGVWEILATGQNNPIEYLPYDSAITLYYLPSSNSAIVPPGEIESYSETTDYTGILLYPVPIKSTNILVAWRAKALPDWDGVSATASDILTNDYTSVILEWCIALSWKFYGFTSRYLERLKYAEKLAVDTIDREDIRKRWQRIKTMPQRRGIEIPRAKQISPFRTPPWTL